MLISFFTSLLYMWSLSLDALPTAVAWFILTHSSLVIMLTYAVFFSISLFNVNVTSSNNIPLSTPSSSLPHSPQFKLKDPCGYSHCLLYSAIRALKSFECSCLLTCLLSLLNFNLLQMLICKTEMMIPTLHGGHNDLMPGAEPRR